MGSVPTQKVEIDLNGTGTLVDVTIYVDFDEGIRHTWGRTASDPFRAEPPPGSLRFTLDNNDGRFTPGNTATYTVGLVEGVLVQWTCGTRVRRFRTGVPDVSFPTQVSGRCTVSVSCLDALALLAKRSLRQMVDEVAFTVQPAVHWPLNDSGPTAVDISGNAEAELSVVGDSSLLSWGNAVGPRTDSRGALSFQPQATTFLADGSSPCLTNTVPIGTLVPQDWHLTSNPIYSGYALSFWFSIRDVYGATFSTTNDYDGPYVILARLAQQTILWRLGDRKLIVGGASTTTPALAMPDLPAVQPGTVHHVFMWVSNNSSSNQCTVRFWLDGVETTSPPGDPLTAHGSATAPTIYLGGSGGTTSWPFAAYGLSGGIGVATVYTYQQATDLVAAGVVPDFYPTGEDGPAEDAGARFQRLGGWLNRSDIAYSVQGTPQTSLCGGQNTEGKSILSAMCTALALEERILDCATVAGVETVRAWMHDRHRGATPAITIDVQDDGTGVPTLTADSSGVAVQCTAQGYSRSVTWLDTTAPERWQGTSATVDAAMEDIDALRTVAQFRTIVGRNTAMTPSSVTVDAASSVASLTTTLLAIEPMDRVRVDGLPAGIVGFSEVDAILVGCIETHALGRNLFDLQLTPDLPYLGAVYDEAMYASDVPGVSSPYSFTTPWSTGGHPITGSFPVFTGFFGGGGTNATLRMTGNGAAPDPNAILPTGAPVDPLYYQIDDEIVQITNVAAPGTLTFTYGTPYQVWEYEWLLTVVRGAFGTTVTTHTQSGGGLIHSGVSTMGVDPAPHTDPRVTFLNMPEQYGF